MSSAWRVVSNTWRFMSQSPHRSMLFAHRVHIRISAAHEEVVLAGIYKFGPFHLDAPERRLFRDGVEVLLRPKTFEVLCMLVQHAGRLVTKNALLRQVW